MTDVPKTLAGAKALVTGATGFIGSVLVRRLRDFGADVYGVYRRTRPSETSEVKWSQCDVGELTSVRHLVATVRPDLVFHLASHVAGGRGVEMVAPTLHDNLVSTVNLLTAVTETGCQRVVLAGSMEEPSPDGNWPVPNSPYSAAKSAASTYGRMFQRLYGTPAVNLRLFMVYGPAQADVKKLIPYTIRSLLQNRAPELSSGQRNVDWIYVDDVVDGFLAAANTYGIEGKTLDIGSGYLVTVREIAERLAHLVNPAISPRFGVVPERPMEREPVANIGETATILGWQPKISLDAGLARTVAWYRAHAALDTLAVV